MANDAEIRLRDRLSKLSGLDLLRGARLSGELERLKRQIDRIEAEPTDEEIWTKVELARHEDRPYTLDYVALLLEDWFELHGDRGRADDAALVAGIGKLEGRTIALIGHQKGHTLQERQDLLLQPLVERRQRFVQQQQSRRIQQRATERDALAFTA